MVTRIIDVVPACCRGSCECADVPGWQSLHTVHSSMTCQPPRAMSLLVTHSKAQGPNARSAEGDFLSSLNPEQREAVLHTDGPLLILAGAGSGKTRVIAYRIAYLIGSALAQPFEVLAVTFTNKAAEEMRERVGKLIGDDARDVWISTFHSLCARLLRREAPAIGLSRDFVIYDSSDQHERSQAGDARAAGRRQDHPAAAGPRAHQPGQEPDGDAGQGRQRHISRRADRQDLRRVRQGARARERARLRRSAAQDRGAVRARRRTRQVPASVPLRDGR